MPNQKNSIPLEKRLVTGTVDSISLGAVHLRLPDDYPYAKRVRIAKNYLPDDRPLDSFNKDEVVSIFILRPSQHAADMWYATAKWADRHSNPWFSGNMRLGTEVRGIADSYVEHFGVIILLENGIEGFLHISNIPNGTSSKNISDLIHIGDNVAALIDEIQSDQVRVHLNIKTLLEKKQREVRFEQDNELLPGETDYEEIETSDFPEAIVPSNTHILLIDNDALFSNALKDWLKILGCQVSTTTHCEAVKTHFQQASVTHVLLDFKLDSAKQSECIRNLCKQQSIPIVFISGSDKAIVCHEARKNRWEFMPKPLDFAILRTWLCTNYAPPQNIEHKKPDKTFWKATYQEHAVGKEVDHFLHEICEETDCDAALWVMRERIGVFSIRSYWGIDAEGLQHIQTTASFSKTWINDVIDGHKEVEDTLFRSGILKNIAPQNSRHIWVFPLMFDNEVHRAVTFFRRKPFDEKCKKNH